MKLHITVRPGITWHPDGAMFQSFHSQVCDVLENPFIGDKKRAFHESVEFVLDYKQELTLNELLSYIHIPKDDCGIIVFNNTKMDFEDKITKDGNIKIYPLILGG